LSHTKNITEYIALSLLAAILLVILIVFTPQRQQTGFATNIIVATAFIASCLIGISMTLKPNWLRNHHRLETNETPQQTPSRAFRGHHPDCEAFHSHTIEHRGKARCAGCLGLSIGLLVAIGLMTTNAVAPLLLSPSLFWLLLGFLMIATVYAETILRWRQPISHVLANSLLAPGYALITIVVTQHTGNSIYGFFTLLLCFLWTDTRIQLSYWRHQELCASCGEPCKSYVEKVTYAG